MMTLIGVELIGLATIGSVANLRTRSWKIMAAMNLVAFVGMALIAIAMH